MDAADSTKMTKMTEMETPGAVTVEVRIPLGLRRLTGRASTVRATGRTVGELLDDLERRFPGFRDRLLDADGNLNNFTNVYRNGEDIRYQGMLETRLADGDQVHIVSAVAGG